MTNFKLKTTTETGKRERRYHKQKTTQNYKHKKNTGRYEKFQAQHTEKQLRLITLTA